jgi:hypothetical protein
MLSKEPWRNLNGQDSVVLEITDPAIKAEYFEEDPEGVRWPCMIEPRHIKVYAPPKGR